MLLEVSMVIIVMGVAGSGKSTVGSLLAASLGWAFVDGDDFHPPANLAKMTARIPLTEEDRAPWLAALRARIVAALAAREDLVVACSALRESHRQLLRVDPARVRLVYLKGDPQTIAQRLLARPGHFMKEDMLASQLATLEEVRDALVVDIAAPPPEIVRQIRAGLSLMRIAVSGAHRTGKSTLLEELGETLAGYTVIDEPYHQLEEEGHEVAEMPSLEDFELQLERSLDDVAGSRGGQLFDRCPADLLAYLLTHEEADAFEPEAWLSRVRSAMRRLDLIVFVPIEDPDRVAGHDDDDLRRRVDEQLREILLDDCWAFGVEVLEVSGSPRERARQVLAHVNRSV
jgi:carbohydrate kinase (thermoresistant glucokinase family)